MDAMMRSALLCFALLCFATQTHVRTSIPLYQCERVKTLAFSAFTPFLPLIPVFACIVFIFLTLAFYFVYLPFVLCFCCFHFFFFFLLSFLHSSSGRCSDFEIQRSVFYGECLVKKVSCYISPHLPWHGQAYDSYTIILYVCV